MLPVTFYDLTSKVRQPHFLCTLLIKAVAKLWPVSRGKSSSRCKKNMGQMYIGVAIFGNYNLPRLREGRLVTSPPEVGEKPGV